MTIYRIAKCDKCGKEFLFHGNNWIPPEVIQIVCVEWAKHYCKECFDWKIPDEKIARLERGGKH